MPIFPEIIAHRGASFDAPENTLAAFALGFKQGAHALETDIRLTSDGLPVAMHDRSLHRTTGCEANVDESPLIKVRELDAGIWRGGQFKGERVPTLSEILASAPRQKRFVIELKTPDLTMAFRRVFAANEAALERAVFISFHYEALREIKDAFPGNKALYLASSGAGPDGKPLTREDLLRLFERVCGDGMDGLDLQEDCPIDAEFVAHMHARGKLLYMWTVDEAATARRLADLNVDGLTTNRPAYIREALKKGAVA